MKKFEYEFEMPAVTTDVIVYCHETKEILLIERKNDPYKGKLAMPGGFLDVTIDENLESCAVRELREETGLDINKKHIDFFNLYSDIDRDSRQRVVTSVYYFNLRKEDKEKAIAQDDAKRIEWVKIDQISDYNLAFDHNEILKTFCEEIL